MHRKEAAILVHVALYGSLSKVWGKRYVAFGDVDLPSGATKADLLDHLNIINSDKGYLFINAVLCDVPGLSAGGDQILNEGDHIGIFAVDYMWPYQYRDGVVMSDALKAAMQKYGAMHHTYENVVEDTQDESAVQENS